MDPERSPPATFSTADDTPAAAREPTLTAHSRPQSSRPRIKVPILDSAGKLGALALRALSEYAPDFVAFARALELPGSAEWPPFPEDESDLKAQLEWATAGSRAAHRSTEMARTVYERVVEKLRREPVEDFRIDFEDGYGNRADAEEPRRLRRGRGRRGDVRRHSSAPHRHPDLLNYFLRAVNCGAITEAEAVQQSGLTLQELRGRSFVKILEARRGP